MVDQRRRLIRQRSHRVDPHVVGLVGLAVPEEVDGDHAVATLRHRRRQSVVHAPIHEQAVDQDEGAVALAVDLVDDAVAAEQKGVAYVGHEGGGVYSRPAGAGAGSDGGDRVPRSHGRATCSADRMARVAGALLRV